MIECMQFCVRVSRIHSKFRSDVETLQAGLIFSYPFIGYRIQIGRCGSVVECLTRDREAAGSSLTCVTA